MSTTTASFPNSDNRSKVDDDDDDVSSSESMRLAVQTFFQNDTQQTFTGRLQRFLEAFQVRC